VRRRSHRQRRSRSQQRHQALVVGTTDKVTSLDPAGAYDNGSFALMNQSYQFLMNFAPGSKDLKPDAAQNCQFSQPTVYTCTMKTGLKFANGHPLTAKLRAPRSPSTAC